MQAVIVAFWLMPVIALAPTHVTSQSFSAAKHAPQETQQTCRNQGTYECLQVGCPEARIDENVAKLTGAGYKVSLDTLLVPVNCIWPFATHTTN